MDDTVTMHLTSKGAFKDLGVSASDIRMNGVGPVGGNN